MEANPGAPQEEATSVLYSSKFEWKAYFLTTIKRKLKGTCLKPTSLLQYGERSLGLLHHAEDAVEHGVDVLPLVVTLQQRRSRLRERRVH